MIGVIYTRVSSKRQSDVRQMNDLKEHALNNGITVVKIFSDYETGLSDSRPGIQDCKEYLFNNNVDILLVHEVSRLSRNVSFIEDFIYSCSKKGICIRFLNPFMDTLNADKSKNTVTDLVIKVLGSYANFEVKQVRDRLQSGRKQAILEGRCMLGRPKGTKMNDYEITSKYKEVVKYIKKDYTIREIAVLCNVSTKTVQKVRNTLKHIKDCENLNKQIIFNNKDICRYAKMGLNDCEIEKLTGKNIELIHSIRNMVL